MIYLVFFVFDGDDKGVVFVRIWVFFLRLKLRLMGILRFFRYCFVECVKEWFLFLFCGIGR